MATLTGTLIKDTYDGLLKTTDNQALPLSGVEVIQDGLGNSSSLSLGQAGNGAEIGGNLSISGWADIDGDLNIDGGDLTTNLTSFNLLNSGVTTINAFGQATTVNMGIGTTNFNMSGSITTGSLNVSDAIIHDGDTDTKIEFLANQIKTTTGGVLNINVVPTATTFYQNVFFDGNIYSTDGNISLTNGDIVTGGHIAINSGNAATSFSSNANNLIVGGADSGTNQGMTIASDSGATGNIFFADGITGDQQYRGLITYNHSSDTMYLGASAANRVTISSGGLSVLTGGKIFVNGAGNNGYINSKGAVAVQVASIDNSRLFRGIDSSVQEVFYVQGTGDVYAKNNITSAAGSLITGYIGATTDVGISALSDLVFGTVTASTITEKMRIDTAGNVGIGDAPDTLLHIKGSAPSFKIESTDTSGSLNIPAGSINFFGGYSDSIEIASIRSIDASSGGVAGQLAFYTSEDPDTPTERMRIDSSGNVGIGGIPIGTGASGSAKTLEVSHSNVAALSVNYTGAPTGKKYDIVADILGFAIWDDSNSAYRMRIDSSGNVGIGNDSPSAVSSNATTLHIKSQATTKGGAIRLDSSDESIKTYMYPNSGDGFRIATSTSHPISFFTANTERMRIDSSGNVGINCTPSEIFQVDKKSSGVIAHLEGNSSYHMTIGEDSGNMYINANNGNATIEFRTNTTERMRIDSSGNIIIANALGTAKLNFPNIVDTNGYDVGSIQLYTSGDGTIKYGLGVSNSQFNYRAGLSSDSHVWYAGTTERMRIDSLGQLFCSNDNLVFTYAGTDAIIASNGNKNMLFYTDGTERMRITSGGTKQFTASGTTNFELTTGGVAWAIINNHTNALDQFFSDFRYNGTSIGSIRGNDISTNYNITSDYRLKEDWQPISSALTRIDALNPINFAWKSNGKRVDGFLAHELQEVIPEAVTGEKDATEEYEVTPAEYKTVVVTPAQEAVYETIEHPAIAEELDADGNIIVEAQEAWTEEVLVSEAVEEVTEQVLVSEAVMGTRPVYQGIDQSKIVPLLTAGLQEAHNLIQSQGDLIQSLEARIQTLENK